MPRRKRQIQALLDSAKKRRDNENLNLDDVVSDMFLGIDQGAVVTEIKEEYFDEGPRNRVSTSCYSKIEKSDLTCRRVNRQTYSKCPKLH